MNVSSNSVQHFVIKSPSLKRLWRTIVLLIILPATFIPSISHAQRVALVIGNANYTTGRLTNPPNDVVVMEAALKKLNFKVQTVLNANQNQMKRAVRDFGTSAQGAEVAFMYYSGHGTQAQGENYLLPVGASIEKEGDYEVEAVSANAVLRQIQGARPKAAILVLDACRDNPMAAITRSGTKGLSRMDAPTGTMIAFATAPNTTASDNGDYAKVLAKELQKPGQELIDVFRNTTAEVRRLSAGKQEPRISEMSISERVYLAGLGTQIASAVAEATAVTSAIGDPELETWLAAQSTNSPGAFQTYLDTFPRGKYASAARIKLDALKPSNSKLSSSLAIGSNDPDAAMWSVAEQGGRIDVYEAYLKQYPKGKYSATALIRIKKFQDEMADSKERETWESAQESASEVSYQWYLANFPNGNHAVLAQKKLDELRSDQSSLKARQEQTLWETAQNGKNAKVLQAYVDKYPNGIYINEAMKKLESLRRAATIVIYRKTATGVSSYEVYANGEDVGRPMLGSYWVFRSTVNGDSGGT